MSVINIVQPILLKKRKKDELPMSLDSVYAEMQRLNLVQFPITLDEKIQHTMVHRYFMSDQFGGNTVMTFPLPSKDLAKGFGIEEFACVTLEWNPLAPQMPGRPGLFFCWEIQALRGTRFTGDDGIMHVFTRVQRIPKALWLYVGNYEFKFSRAIRREEWMEQPVVVSFD